MVPIILVISLSSVLFIVLLINFIVNKDKICNKYKISDDNLKDNVPKAKPVKPTKPTKPVKPVKKKILTNQLSSKTDEQPPKEEKSTIPHPPKDIESGINP